MPQGGGIDSGFIPWSDLSGQTEYYLKGLSYKPKRICWFTGGSPSNRTVYYYNEDTSTTLFYGEQGTVTSNNGYSIGGNTYWNGLKSVENDGFKLEKFTSSYMDANSGLYWYTSKD